MSRKDMRFLKDSAALERIVAYADPRPPDRVLEVGAGPGNLTARLAARGVRVTAIEKDAALADALRRRALPGVEVVRGDALKTPWPAFDLFVSNIPYSITAPLLFRLLEHRFRRAVLTVQREVAERLVARPSTTAYGRLSVGAQRRASIEVLETLPPSAFRPRPRVASAVVRLEPRADPPREEEEAWLQEVLRALFSRRRKKIATTAREAWGLTAPLARGDDRPENLSPDELAALAAEIRTKLKRS